jgi:DNA-binding transcriptional MerR regulator
MGQHLPMRRIKNGSGAPPSEIPDKLYFRIGEVARLCEVPAYVLRFWESEFPQLKPNKGGTGQRLYRRRDVELALRAKTLLKDEGFTIPGARQMLKSELKQKEPQLALLTSAPADIKSLRALRRELESIATMLARPVGKGTGARKSTTKSLSQVVPEENSAQPIRSARHVSMPTAAEIASNETATIEPISADLAPTPVPPVRSSEPASSAGLLFDLFDAPQSSEGDER